MSIENDPLFAEGNEVKVEYKNLKMGKVGDWFKGTLTDNTRKMTNNLSAKKEEQTIFEFKAHGGSFHDIVDRQVQPEATVVNAGEFWSYIVGGVKAQQLKKANIGDIVGIRFTEERKSKVPGQNPAKIVSVFVGGPDPEYQGETAADR